MTHAFFGEPRMPRLSKLLQEFKQGEILVPRFQRPFLWTIEKRLELLSSVYHGYPIGAILVWRTQKHNLATYESLGPLRLPQSTDPTVVRQYLLDGHQRMTTLFAALGPALYDIDGGESLEWIDETDERGRWPIYFDLESTDSDPFRLPRANGTRQSTWLPLDILFDPYKLNDFGLALQTAGYDRKLINRVQSIAEKFRDYVIPVMPIATEDLEQVTLSFKRVNSGGSRMSEVHMVHALSFRHEFDLLEKLEEVQESFKPIGWERLDEQMILNACKLRLGMELYRDDSEVVAKKLRKHPESLRRAGDDLARTARVLDKVAGVRSPRSLPYGYQLLLMADALREMDTDNLPFELQTKLEDWFWATTLGEHFSGITGSQLEKTRLHLRDVVAGRVEDVKPPGIPQLILPVHRFDYRLARCRGIGLLLAEKKPAALDVSAQGPTDGFGLLGSHGVAALSTLVKEKELEPAKRFMVHGPENRFLVEPQKSDTLRFLRSDLARFEHRTLESHAIDKDAIESFAQGDVAEFLRLRRKWIEHLEEWRAKACGLEYRLTHDALREYHGVT